MATFISARIDAFFKTEPLLKKRPGAPDAFVWEGQRFDVVQLLSEWHDYDNRREREMTRHTPTQLARKQGSWGVGRDFYRVRTDSGRVFDLYFDRSPKGADDIGRWVLYRELDEADFEMDPGGRD